MNLFHRKRTTPARRRSGLVVLSTLGLAAALVAVGASTAEASANRDTTAPSTPTFASTAYPAAGPTTVTAGGSGVITLSSTDSGRRASGVVSFAYNINGASLTSGGVAGTARASSVGRANVTVALSNLHWGSNVLWAQAIDGAGNRSPVARYDFYVQQSAFGPFTPGRGGDLTGDGAPDLVTVNAAGDIQLFAGPETTTVDPTGDTTNDPHQYGGRVLVPARQNPRWSIPDSASASGALVTHGGSFNGNTNDDLIVVQNGHLAVATDPGTTAPWTFATTNVTKPACAGCANYNAQDWSSVSQLIAVQTAPGGHPNLLTVEIVNDTTTVWWYPAVTAGFRFGSPTAVSVNTGAWHWDDLQLVGAGPLPGTTGVSLLVRDPDAGRISVLHNVVAGLPNPSSTAVVVATGFTAAAYPLLTSPGTADSRGNLPLWATDAAGQLLIVPTSTGNAGVTTVRAPKAVSAAGWASHEIALGSNYPPYNNTGVATPGTANGAFDQTTANAYAYSAAALPDATIDPDAIVNDGSGGCPIGWSTCVAGLGSSTAVALPNDIGTFDIFTLPGPWAHRRDNYAANGQLLPLPVPGTDGPAHAIRFLGAAATTDQVNGASVAATITYTDGHTQTVTVTFANWTQDVTVSPVAGNTIVSTMDNRTVAATGADDPTTNYLFATPEIALLDAGAAIPADVQIASVRLGTNTAVHVFSIAVS